MDTVEREELRRIVEEDRGVRVVLTLGPDAYAQAHIPGSESFPDLDSALRELSPEDDVVLYCSHAACSSSRRAARRLQDRGLTRVRVYRGGLADWHAAGLPLQGSAA
ncbi:MAG TPA: rhodanese-like domain-containing protein [Jiangellales bacterium]|nr:rhodanese-like domain-containing protein [Jiangellales bacterium]